MSNPGPQPGLGLDPEPEPKPEPTLTIPCDVAHVMTTEHSEFAIQLFSADVPAGRLLGSVNKIDKHVVSLRHASP